MSSRELERVEVMGRVKHGNLPLKDAAVLLELSYRQVKRVWKSYQEKGRKGLKHGHAGKASNRSQPSKLRRQALNLIRRKYSGTEGERFGPTLAAEHLAEEDGDQAMARAYYQKLSDRFRNYYYGELASQRMRTSTVENVSETNRSTTLARGTPIRGGWQCAGVDIDREHVEIAKSHGMDARHCDLNHDRLPFGDESFDLIFAGEVIEHLIDTDGFLSELSRCVRRGGAGTARVILLRGASAASAGDHAGSHQLRYDRAQRSRRSTGANLFCLATRWTVQASKSSFRKRALHSPAACRPPRPPWCRRCCSITTD